MADIRNALEAKATGTVAQKKQPQSIKDWIKVMEPQIKKALPSVITPERFTRMALTAVSSNPKLAECTPESFCGAMMNAAQLGLEPNTSLGQAYLIPYRNKGVMECQFQIGYRGMLNMFYRDEKAGNVDARVVYEKDEFEYSFGLEPTLKHIPYKGVDKGRATHYYAVFHLKTGGFGFEVMSFSEMEAFAKKYSQAYAKGWTSPWTTNFDEMAKKTVIKKVLKYAPMSAEFQRGMAQDETIKSVIEDDMSSVSDETAWAADYEVVEEEQVTVDQETGEVK